MDNPLQSALAHHRAGRFKDARKHYREALKQSPGNADIHHMLGLALAQWGKLDEALKSFAKAVDLAPNNAEAQFNFGNALRLKGRKDAAIRAYRAAAGARPGYAEALANLGGLLHEAGDLDTARATFEDAVAAAPENTEALVGYGLVLMDAGEAEPAAGVFRRATDLAPDLAAIQVNLGSAEAALGRMDAAVAAYETALALDPASAEARNNLGNAYERVQLWDEAVAQYAAALEIKPDYAEAHYNMGNVLGLTGRAADAITHYESALAQRPDYPRATAQLFHQFQQVCNWPGAAEAATRMEADTVAALAQGEVPAETPFMSISRTMDGVRNLAIARNWATEAEPIGAPDPHRFDDRRQEKDRLRIGYISSDLRAHPVAHAVAALFEAHDRQAVEVFAYSSGRKDTSQWHARITGAVDHLRDINPMSHADTAKLIAEDGIDILVDLNGHTHGMRLEVAARRAAPLQAVWLGFAGTSGADFFDYAIVDPVVAPEMDAPSFSESLARLPHCYMVAERPSRADTAKRAEFGLPEGAPVFASFNQGFKIEPETFANWMRVLAAVPDGVLWIGGVAAPARKNLARAAADAGIAGDCLIFAERVASKSDHLARLALADLALDTRIYNGHVTTLDALSAGLPVLTLAGGHFASRVSASMLRAVKLSDLITGDADSFVARAQSLVGDRAALGQIRARLIDAHNHAPLFDPARFARAIESLYAQMWARFKAGEAPGPLSVKDSGP
jgi:protein O-GlcNAc transferase